MSAAFGPIGVIAETERLVIRPWQPDEADRYLDLYQHPEVIRWFPPGPMPTRQQAVERIERNRAEIAHDPRFGRWAVVDRATGAQAGTIILKPLPDGDGDGEVEIAWHFHPDSWGRGLASEAAVAVLARGFEEGVNEVWALTDPVNRRSIGVCKRIGMRLLGITNRWYHEPYLMFWIGARDGQQPSLPPDGPAPAQT
jgi:RimJ/RimL family protein N-acetyltransferase